MFSTPSREVEIRLTVSLPAGRRALRLSLRAYLGLFEPLMLLGMICLWGGGQIRPAWLHSAVRGTKSGHVQLYSGGSLRLISAATPFASNDPAAGINCRPTICNSRLVKFHCRASRQSKGVEGEGAGGPFLFAELTPVAPLSVYPAQVSMETGGGLSPDGDSYRAVSRRAALCTNDIFQ